MAGVKGKSGGARSNAGGKRSGAGRKPKSANESATPKSKGTDKPIPQELPTPAFDLAQALLCSDPRKFLLAAMNDPWLDSKLRVDAAKALMPYEHPRKEGGKKEQQQKDAEKIASRFAPVAAPRLVANSGKKV